MALQTNSEAYLPVFLSLTKLYARSFWHVLTGGKQKGLWLWGSDKDDDRWYPGKAKEDMRKRLRGRKGDTTQHNQAALAAAEQAPAAEGDLGDSNEDPVQWARERRQREAEAENGEFGPDDYYGRRRGANDQVEGDEMAETMVLVLLCTVVTVLIWARGRWVERGRREDDQNQQENPRNDLGPANVIL